MSGHKVIDLMEELQASVDRAKAARRQREERRPRPVEERVQEILETIDAAESPGWFTTRQGMVAHYDTGHGVALCGVGHLVRRAQGAHRPCERCELMIDSRKDQT